MPPGAAMKPNKAKAPPPGPPAKPKPATGAKPPPPAAAKPPHPAASPEFPRTGSLSRNEYKPPSRVNSVSFPPPKPAAPQQQSANQTTNGMIFCLLTTDMFYIVSHIFRLLHDVLIKSLRRS